MQRVSNSAAWGRVARVVRKSDVVLEVMDARLPLRSSKLEQMVQRQRKKLIFVLNKCDLASKAELRDWQKKIRGAILFSSEKRIGKVKIKSAILASSSKKPVRVGVVGYPNVGKSSLINTMAHRKAASTSPVAGHTRGEQWIRSGNILFLDTPGVIPGNQSQMRLALANAIDADIIKDPERVAIRLIGMTDAQDVYGLDGEGKAFLQSLARKHGKLLKGGVPNLDYSAKLVIRDFQRGKLRRVQNVKNRSEE